MNLFFNGTNFKIASLEELLSQRQRRNRESDESAKRAERLYKHLASQAEDERQNNRRLQEQVARLQHQVQVIKRQVEEAEEIASINLAKFRMASNQLKDAEERAIYAEAELKKLKEIK